MKVPVRLQREHKTDIDAPAWQEVVHALETIDPRRSGFVILSRPDGSYVQCAGARLRLIIEWRKTITGSEFKHFVIGKTSDKHKATSINTSVGIIQLQQNEILSIKNAAEVFQRFYDSGTIPESYVVRDVTDKFSGQ